MPRRGSSQPDIGECKIVVSLSAEAYWPGNFRYGETDRSPSSGIRLSGAVGLILFFSSCGPLLVPNPPSGPDSKIATPATVVSHDSAAIAQPVPSQGNQKEVDTDSGLDFAEVFAEAEIAVPDEDLDGALDGESQPRKVVAPITAATVPTDMVRIAVRRNCSRQVVYSTGHVVLRSGREQSSPLRGRIELQIVQGKLLCTAGRLKFTYAVPCTLSSVDAYSFIEVDSVSYRGGLILDKERDGGRLLVINYLHVEEYLRGVVPLELGQRGNKYKEAIKAQAVAARTYTYRKMLTRITEPYDLLPTVADQVYGGSSVEYRSCDNAIRSTRGLVMVSGDSMVIAYYHSTCGGRTANVSDVWNKPPRPYLVSVSDIDPSGKAYCESSRYYRWHYSWSIPRCSAILARYAPQVAAEGSFGGTLRSMRIAGKFRCGRVRRLEIRSTKGTMSVDGDQIRFALRRDIAGQPILPSSRFTIDRVDSKGVEISGSGYGHGVGMCQMGALGRALEGQSFEEILRAYYTGITIVHVRKADLNTN